MDRRLSAYYNRELRHLRSMAGEFAHEFPKIAGRLALSDLPCPDPYVERLLEGFAFLAARVHLKLDAEFPEFTQEILETVYPHYLAPTPSMAVVQFEPDMSQGDLADGFTIKRGEILRSVVGGGDRTACEYRTSQDVTLWPVAVSEAQYCTRELGALDLPASAASAKAGIRIRLRAGGELTLADVATDTLTVFIRGVEDLPVRIYEQVFAQAFQVVGHPAEIPRPWQEIMPAACIRQVGFEDDQALLPVAARSFQGYRLLHEYFTFPDRFVFFQLTGLQSCFKRCEGKELDLVILLRQEDLELEGQLEAGNFALHCTPAINLFPKRTDRIHLSDRYAEHHVVADRTRPMDFEIYRVLSVTGYGVRSDDEQPFKPFYSATDAEADEGSGAYFTVNRTPRLMSSREKQRGRRSSYGGSEVFLSLVDSKAAPYRSDLRQLAVESLCTNRDLPLRMGVGRGSTDFGLDVSAPVMAVRCIAGPTPPYPSHALGKVNWRIVNHLCLNYLSLVDTRGKGAAALRDLLRLYGDANDPQVRKQIEGVASVSSRPITRRIKTQGPIAFARGLEITTLFDEAGFEGTGVFLLGAVLDVFFSKYVSINSFTETVIRTKERGEIMRWPTRTGIRHTL